MKGASSARSEQAKAHALAADVCGPVDVGAIAADHVAARWLQPPKRDMIRRQAVQVNRMELPAPMS
jgi:hypothetical protein